MKINKSASSSSTNANAVNMTPSMNILDQIAFSVPTSIIASPLDASGNFTPPLNLSFINPMFLPTPSNVGTSGNQQSDFKKRIDFLDDSQILFHSSAKKRPLRGDNSSTFAMPSIKKRKPDVLPTFKSNLSIPVYDDTTKYSSATYRTNNSSTSSSTTLTSKLSPPSYSNHTQHLIEDGNTRLSSSIVVQDHIIYSEDSQFAAIPRTPSSHNPCKCRKSRCLKLYCECFAARVLCSGCNCYDCHNTDNIMHAKERENAILTILDKSSDAFHPKTIALTPSSQNSNSRHSLTNSRKCKCRNSGCLKKYCECFKVGSMCGDSCICLGCKNRPGVSQAPSEPSPPSLQSLSSLSSNPIPIKNPPREVLQGNLLRIQRREPFILTVGKR